MHRHQHNTRLFSFFPTVPAKQKTTLERHRFLVFSLTTEICNTQTRGHVTHACLLSRVKNTHTRSDSPAVSGQRVTNLQCMLFSTHHQYPPLPPLHPSCIPPVLFNLPASPQSTLLYHPPLWLIIHALRLCFSASLYSPLPAILLFFTSSGE